VCETWYLTIREGHRLRVLRRIFGPKREGVTVGWRNLHNEGLHTFTKYYYFYKIRKDNKCI